MKKHAFTPRCTFEYEVERSRDLMRAYKQVFTQTDGLSLPQLLAVVVAMPAQRFYVSEERAMRVVSSMYRRPLPEGMNPAKRRMYLEIKERVDRVRERCPEWRLSRCIMYVVGQPAPEFYLTVSTARTILSKARRVCRESQRRSFQQWSWFSAR
jgi:hypothetical protein